MAKDSGKSQNQSGPKTNTRPDPKPTGGKGIGGKGGQEGTKGGGKKS